MATITEIAALRLSIAESDETTYSDAELATRLDADGSTSDSVAYDIWIEKAAAAADLVDITEGGSSRKNGDLHEQALAMANVFASRVVSGQTPPGLGSGPRIRPLTRR